jgi:CTP:phosphocholine cytidylyltransferase-like protein
MIIENTGLNGIKSELGHLDDITTGLGFVRWQWEYTRATYDCKLEDKQQGEEYFLRISTRAVEGKLENPYAVLAIEESYVGRATFPHGLDYSAASIPDYVVKAATQKLIELKNKLN